MIIMHIDANSAYLSWTAAYMLEKGYGKDIRTIPSCIAGDPENRHGIILTKSIPAREYGVKTGESIMEAKKKCPCLKIYPPDYDLYLMCSDAMYDILNRYSPTIERYSVDECFMDCSRSPEMTGDPEGAALEIKECIKNELGFTVNVGVSENKLLAKMGSELEKPDKVHSLFPHEIRDKMWPLDVRELFMVGRATEEKLKKININTIGDLAGTDPLLLQALLKSHGRLIWEYANGIDDSPVTLNRDIVQKSVGNSITIAYDVEDIGAACRVLLALCERVGMRLRRLGCKASRVAISIKSSEFMGCRHQVKLQSYIDSTSEIYRIGCELLAEAWRGDPIRQIGISVGDLIKAGSEQISMENFRSFELNEKIDAAVDGIRRKYGDRAVIRGTFANGDVDGIQGGVNDGNYIMMGGHDR